MNPKTILLIEDDAALLRGMADNLAARGYHVETASDGERGLEKARRLGPDLAILDVMLPRINGYEICRCLRQEGRRFPVVFVTAKAEESDVLLGLGLGADDYVRKPFGIRELVARVEAVLRRAPGPSGGGGEAESERRFGDFVLDRSSRSLRRIGGGVVDLSPKEYGLLDFLVTHAGRALSREAIMDGVWGYDARVSGRSIDRFVTTLRRKIETDPDRPHIETIREYGYRFRDEGAGLTPTPARSTRP